MRSRPTWLLGVVAAVALVAAACGGSSQQAGTPGFDGNQKQVDRSPFEMANPTTTAGPTTIPGAAPTLLLPTTTDASGNSARVGSVPDVTATPQQGANPFTPVGPATTTTAPLAPAPGAGVSSGTICGFADFVRSMLSFLINDKLDVRSATIASRETILRYRANAPVPLVAEMQLVSDTVLRLLTQLEQAGYNTKDPALAAESNALAKGEPSAQPFRAAFSRIAATEATLCQQRS